MAGTENSRSIRGPLRYVVDTSSQQVQAGKKFSVTIQITNPYDVPVTIYGLATQLPVELIDRTTPSDKPRFWSLLKQDFVHGLSRSNKEPGPANKAPVAESGSGFETVSSSGPTQDPTVVLQPGNSAVRTFTVKTRSATFFPPASYNLYFWIDYDIDQERNKDAVRYSLNIRSPLSAMIYGAIGGSILGFILRSITGTQNFTIPQQWSSVIGWLAQLLSSVLAAAIAVIAFARKKDTQPILSIEDFWGGFFIGFLAGYTGKSFLNQFTNLKS